MIRYVAGREPSVGSNGLGNPSTLVMPNPVNTGDLLFALVKEVLSTSAVTIPNFSNSGSGRIQIGNSTSHFLWPMHCLAAAGQSATITATEGGGTPSVSQMGVGEFSGVLTTQDAAMVVTNGGATSKTSQATGNITTTTPECLLIAFLGQATASAQATTVVDSGFTIFGKGNQLAVAFRIVRAAGTYGATWSWVTAGVCTAGIMAFRADPAAVATQAQNQWAAFR
jgi:hypothetical protein